MKKTMQLFCIPHAGGSAAMYNEWSDHIWEGADVIKVELSGRGRRIREKLYENFTEAVSDVYGFIKQKRNGAPFCIFGHSMGAWLAFETACLFGRSSEQGPSHLFLSGARPPHETRNEEKLHLLAEDEFRKAIAGNGGTDSMITEDPDIFSFFSPIIRSDYRILENFSPAPVCRDAGCGITVFRGSDDSYSRQDMEEWNKYTKTPCRQICIDGDHFFINKNRKNVIDEINRIIEKAQQLKQTERN